MPDFTPDARPPARKFVFNNADEDVPAASPGYFVELTVALGGGGGETAQLLAHSKDLVYSLLPSLSKSGFLAGYSEAEVAGLEVLDTAGRLLQHHHTLEQEAVQPVDMLTLVPGQGSSVGILEKSLQAHHHTSAHSTSGVTKSCNTPSRWKMGTLVCLVLSLSLLATGCSLWLLSPGQQAEQARYLVLLDAGSVHTTAYTYRTAAPWGLTQQHACELRGEQGTTTGVSSFTRQPSRAATFVTTHPCLAASMQLIPPEARHVSGLLLGSTAGMRTLSLHSPSLAQQVLGNLSAGLEAAATAHQLTSLGAKVLTGEQEAQDGWVTANYLARTLRPRAATLGALDWGGASSQVTFLSSNPALAPLHLNHSTFRVEARSNLCYGQAEALRRHRFSLLHHHYAALLNTTSKEVEVPDPCLPQGARLPVPVSALLSSPCTVSQDTAFMAWVAGQAARGLALVFTAPDLQDRVGHCRAEVLKAFGPACTSRYAQGGGEGVCLEPATIPPPPPEGRYLAMSTYWYLSDSLGLGETTSLGEYDRAVTSVCEVNYATLVARLGARVAHQGCFQASFMRSLLVTGYHFSSDHLWANIHFVKEFEGAEVGWTLGHALAVLDSMEDEGLKRPVYLSTTHFVVLMIFSGVSFLVCLALAYQSRKAREMLEEPYRTLA